MDQVIELLLDKKRAPSGDGGDTGEGEAESPFSVPAPTVPVEALDTVYEVSSGMCHPLCFCFDFVVELFFPARPELGCFHLCEVGDRPEREQAAGTAPRLTRIRALVPWKKLPSLGWLAGRSRCVQ